MITRADISEIAELSTHCDLNKLNIAIAESRDFDLEPLFCAYWDDILVIMDKVEAETATPLEINLINGGEFTNCKDKTIKHKGVKAIWAYYAYARYMMLNGFNDTPNGNVSKTNNFSIPKPLKEVEMFSDKYRSMGFESYKKTHNFLCRNSDDFPDFDTCECEECGCGNTECGGTKAKGYGFKFSTIKKLG